MRLNIFLFFWSFPAAKRSYCVLIFHETFLPDFMVPANGKNYKITSDVKLLQANHCILDKNLASTKMM